MVGTVADPEEALNSSMMRKKGQKTGSNRKKGKGY